MRLRTGITKKLLLGGATAFSIVGFAAPAAFAMDGGGGYNNSDGYSSNMNYNNSYNDNNYNCDNMMHGNYNGWDGNYMNRYCMSRVNYSSNNNNHNRCDRNKYPTLY